jgi:hypothetical protein
MKNIKRNMKEYIINEDKNTITAKELIDFLKKIPENTPVFLGGINKEVGGTKSAYKVEYFENFGQAFISGNE